MTLPVAQISVTLTESTWEARISAARLPEGLHNLYSEEDFRRLLGETAMLRDAQIELTSTQRKLIQANAEIAALVLERNGLTSVLPGSYYMDPPDGGDVSVIEQLRRMAEDAAKYRAARVAHCDRPGGCVCGGDLPSVRAGCGNWVMQ